MTDAIKAKLSWECPMVFQMDAADAEQHGDGPQADEGNNMMYRGS